MADADRPVIDPGIAAALAAQAEALVPFDPTTLPPAVARRRTRAWSSFFGDAKPDMERVEEVFCAGPGGPLKQRIYRPANAGVHAIYYVHGGGWTFCDLDTHDRLMRYLAQSSGATVIGVDYRMAPEHPFPAPLDDVRAGWRWLLETARARGIDPGRIAVAGDSAGANLALALCLAERDDGRAMPAAAGLFYGCFTPDFDTPSHLACGGGQFVLSTARMRWFWTNYIGADFAAAPVLAAPLHAELKGLPPLYLNAAGLDPLLDDTLRFEARAKAAGLRYSLDVWPGTTHGFLGMTRDAEIAREAVGKAGAALRELLAG